ncbi:MAG: NAD(P)H-dependent oxidoreductase subunit E [Chloroflexi bacterium]|nr:NAD(P)H-dependent oxidoreductase subunit E [Chloroflexota bacterium]
MKVRIITGVDAALVAIGSMWQKQAGAAVFRADKKEWRMAAEMDSEKVQGILERHSERVNAIIDGYEGRKDLMISLLQDVQAEFNYVPRDAMVQISQRLDVPLSQVFSIATFFKAFNLTPRGRHLITVCDGTACHVRGGLRLIDKLDRDLGLTPGGTTEDGRFTLETVRCLGACALGPLMVIDGKYHGQMSSNKLDRTLRSYT